MTKAEKTRLTILERSAPLLNKKGIAGTAMSDIMEATGLAKGSLYVHFEDKDNLVEAVAGYMLDRQKHRVDQAISRKHSVKEKLMAFFSASVSAADLPIPGGCPMLNLGLEADDTNPAVRARVLKMTETMQKEISDLVKQGIRTREFRSGFPAEEFAIRSFAMLEGGIFLSKLSGNGRKLSVILEAIGAEIESYSN